MNVRSEESRARLQLWWTRLATMTVKELIQFGRDTLLLLAIVYLFVFDTYMAGNVSMQLNHAVVVVHDADHSAASRELVYRFRPPYFKLGGEVLDNREGQRLLDQGQALVALDIPPHFERDLLQG
jgi:ABC-2 type transport system permease protein